MAVARGAVLCRGSLRLIAARWLVFVVAALPGLFATTAALQDTIGYRPWITEAPRPVSIDRYLAIWGEASPGMGVLGIGAGLAWLAALFVTAGSVAVARDGGRAWTTVRREIAERGSAMLLPYLRVALAAAALAAVAGLLIDLGFDAIKQHGAVAGWTGLALKRNMTGWRVVSTVLALSTIGVGVFWTRVILAADGRRYVRRVPLLVLRLLLQRPLSAFAFQLVAALATIAGQAAYLVAWHQSPGSYALWIPGWLLLLALSAWVWLWRIRAAVFVWESETARGFRPVPDGPWGLFRRRIDTPEQRSVGF